MSRLPNPGGDDGQWGVILNDFLSVEHNTDGTLKKATEITNKADTTSVLLKSSNLSDLPDPAVARTNLGLGSAATKTAATTTTAASNEVVLGNDARLSSAQTAVQTVNSIAPSSGNVSLTASDVSAIPTSQKGAASGVATLDTNSILTQSQDRGGAHRGAWQASTAYKANDMVVYQGLTYTANTDFTTTGVFSSANWTALPGFIQDGGTAFAVASGAWNTTATGGSAGGSHNTTGFRIYLVIRAGVASNPGQNGHIYIEIAPNNNGGALPTSGWQTVDYVACRNNQAVGTGGSGVVSADSSALIGAGRGLAAFVPKDWWYRLRTYVVTGYSTPTFITDGATPGFFYTVT